jgi:hypothetical protein
MAPYAKVKQKRKVKSRRFRIGMIIHSSFFVSKPNAKRNSADSRQKLARRHINKTQPPDFRPHPRHTRVVGGNASYNRGVAAKPAFFERGEAFFGLSPIDRDDRATLGGQI